MCDWWRKGAGGLLRKPGNIITAYYDLYCFLITGFNARKDVVKVRMQRIRITSVSYGLQMAINLLRIAVATADSSVNKQRYPESPARTLGRCTERHRESFVARPHDDTFASRLDENLESFVGKLLGETCQLQVCFATGLILHKTCGGQEDYKLEFFAHKPLLRIHDAMEFPDGRAA